MSRAPLTICLAGWSGAGKTSLAERLVPRLLARGQRVAFLKADAHTIDRDVEGKDTDRVRRAGAEAVAIVSASGEAMLTRSMGPRFAGEHSSEELAAFDHSVRARLWNLRPSFRGADLLLIEGMKRSALPKLWIERARDEATEREPEDLRGVIGRVLLRDAPSEAEWDEQAERALDCIDTLASTPTRRAAADVMGVVLAGGTSERMGRDKACLPISGWPVSPESPTPGTWLERAFLLLAERTLEPWILGRIVEAGDVALPLLEAEVRSHLDLVSGQGPLGGLASALRVARGKAVLALPCDLPELPAEAIDLLLLHRRGAATAFTHQDGRREPAVLLLEASALAPIEAAIARGARKLESLLEEIGVHWVEIPADLSPGFRNLNRPEDLAT